VRSGQPTDLIRGDFAMPDDNRKIWERYSRQAAKAKLEKLYKKMVTTELFKTRGRFNAVILVSFQNCKVLFERLCSIVDGDL
jgi:DNA-binding transcriptional regulator YbjK